jgi:protein gp37
MAENTAIEWCDHTFNPWLGCTKISPGCDHCYAEAKMDKRLHRVHWGPGQPRVRTKTWRDPVRWNGAHEAFYAAHGRRQRVFCASLADVFDNEVPREWRADLFSLVRSSPNLDWLLLTKRIGNAKAMIEQAMRDQGDDTENAGWPWANVWIGATVVNQAEADRDIPKLLEVPARVRFLSIEPMLGQIDLTRVQWPGKHKVDVLRGGAWDVPSWHGGFTNHSDMGRVHWVIAGGESGPNARPAHPDWFRSLRDQCAAAGVPFFMKQMGGARDKRGALADLPEDLRVREFPT